MELSLDPSELEGLDSESMAARYEQTLREQQGNLAKEDFSDMVAEHAAKQKVILLVCFLINIVSCYEVTFILIEQEKATAATDGHETDQEVQRV